MYPQKALFMEFCWAEGPVQPVPSLLAQTKTYGVILRKVKGAISS